MESPRQPQTYELLLARVDDKDFIRRVQALDMLGSVCAATPTLRPKILPVLRERIGSSNNWTQQGALHALGKCGIAEDIELLRALPACSNQWNVKGLCKQVEDKISKRVNEQEGPVAHAANLRTAFGERFRFYDAGTFANGE